MKRIGGWVGGRGRGVHNAVGALAGVAALAGLAACGPVAPAEGPPAASGEAAVGAAPSGTAAVEGTAAPTVEAVATAAPVAAKPGVPIEDAPAPGTQPLTAAEQKEMSGACKKLTDAVAAAAKKDGAKKRPIDYVDVVLANPPKLPGVDVPRCSGLLRRDMVSYLADSRESEAKLTLRRIVVGLVTALEKEPPVLCPGAGAVPAALDAVKDAPYVSKPEEWKAPGWACARLDLSGAPQVWQYELRTDAKARSFEVIARGYPVQGAASTEIFIAGKVESGAIDPSTPIQRRQP